jgi:hypothetical protein
MHDMNNIGSQNGMSLLVTVVTLIIFTLMPVECTRMDKTIIFGVGSNLVGGYQLLEKKKKPAAYIFRIGT